MNNTNPQILIIDDQLAVRETLKGLLMQENYEFTLACNGPEALALLNTFEPDTILLDVMMPNMDGFEVCRCLKADARWQHIPVILVTALDSKEEMVRGFDAGADDFLTKPVNGLELQTRVRSMLRIKKQFDTLQAAIQLREDMAHMIVHDMRTPLTVILGFSELLQNGYITTDDDAALANLHQQALYLNALVTDILLVAKMEQGKLILNRATVDINQLVQKVTADYRFIAQSREIRLITNLPQNSCSISLDANLFKRVLANLLSNALKFSRPETTVTLQVQAQEPHLHIKVFDQGPGIPANDRERIFNKFEVAGLKQKGASSFGIGLAFCKLVIEAHGGRIFVEGNEPNGSVFTIEI